MINDIVRKSCSVLRNRVDLQMGKVGGRGHWFSSFLIQGQYCSIIFFKSKVNYLVSLIQYKEATLSSISIFFSSKFIVLSTVSCYANNDLALNNPYLYPTEAILHYQAQYLLFTICQHYLYSPLDYTNACANEDKLTQNKVIGFQPLITRRWVQGPSKRGTTTASPSRS